MFQQTLVVRKHYLLELLFHNLIFICVDYGVNPVRYDI